MVSVCKRLFFRAIFVGVARVSFRFSGSGVGSQKEGDLRTPYREASRRSREPSTFWGLFFRTSKTFSYEVAEDFSICPLDRASDHRIPAPDLLCRLQS